MSFKHTKLDTNVYFFYFILQYYFLLKGSETVILKKKLLQWPSHRKIEKSGFEEGEGGGESGTETAN